MASRGCTLRLRCAFVIDLTATPDMAMWGANSDSVLEMRLEYCFIELKCILFLLPTYAFAVGQSCGFLQAIIARSAIRESQCQVKDAHYGCRMFFLRLDCDAGYGCVGSEQRPRRCAEAGHNVDVCISEAQPRHWLLLIQGMKARTAQKLPLLRRCAYMTTFRDNLFDWRL